LYSEADELKDVLVSKGSDAVWEYLEKYYERIFADF